MNLKKESIPVSYTPVAWEYREVAQEQMDGKTSGKIFYFCQDEGICEQIGKIVEIREITGKGLFVVLDNAAHIRMDRIITLFGKPGAAYEEYDSYANSCMSCLGGYEPEEL